MAGFGNGDQRAPWEMPADNPYPVSPREPRTPQTPLGFGTSSSKDFGSGSRDGLSRMDKGSVTGLSSFGILLTGRLELRNDLLSTLSLGKDVWEERYFVLTRKGLHYYLREKGKTDGHGRDLFGHHEGSVAIRAMREVDVGGGDDHRPLVFTLKTHGLGRDYTLRARSPELFQRWSTTIASAIDEIQHPRDGLLGSGEGKSMLFASRSSSFPRVPSLFDFRAQPPKTDNLTHLVLKSSALKLDVLLENGLPWGVSTTLCARRHRLRLQDDCLELHLEGGGNASVPLRSTLRLKPAGSTTVTLNSPALHKCIKVMWRPATVQPGARAAASQRARVRGWGPAAWAGSRSVALAAVVLSWLAGRLWPAVGEPLLSLPLPPTLLPPTSLLPPLAVVAVLVVQMLLARASRRVASWRERSRASWLVSLAPVPEPTSPLGHASMGGDRLSSVPASPLGPASMVGGRLATVPPSPLAPSHLSSLASSNEESRVSTVLEAQTSATSDASAQSAADGADGDNELQMDALFAAAASSEHSLLHGAAEALRGAMPPATAGSAALEDADGLKVETLYAAFEGGIVRIFEALGPSMLLVVKNDQSNLAKLRAALDAAHAEGAGTSGADARDLTVGELLRHEVEQQLHTCGAPGAALADPSGAMALLWLRRSGEFMMAMARRLQGGMDQVANGAAHDVDTAEALRGAYQEVLQPYHSWLLRQTFNLVTSQAPCYADFAISMGPGLGDAERDQVLAAETLVYMRAVEPLVRALTATFAKLQLEDQRRV